MIVEQRNRRPTKTRALMHNAPMQLAHSAETWVYCIGLDRAKVAIDEPVQCLQNVFYTAGKNTLLPVYRFGGAY